MRLPAIHQSPAWYLVAGVGRGRTAVFRAGRIGSVQILNEPFERPAELGLAVVTLSFEHELAAAQRLAGFGGRVEVLSPPPVRDGLVAAAQGILDRYGS
jgi:predicted DNA-binding transcriptional regulator YafY